MRRRETEALLTVLAERTCLELASDSCILGTKIAITVLRSKGLRAVPMPVGVVVINRVFADRLAASRTLDGAGESADEWGAAGAWMIHVGHREDIGPVTGGWDGHLVALVENRYLLDVSAGQFSRPTKNIAATPFWMPVERPFLRGERGLVVRGKQGEIFRYTPEPENESFLTAPSWTGYRIRVAGERVEARRTIPQPANDHALDFVTFSVSA